LHGFQAINARLHGRHPLGLESLFLYDGLEQFRDMGLQLVYDGLDDHALI
jgi:hypothetical protein